MSVFSILKRGRQAKGQPDGKQAEPQSDKQAGKQKEELATPRYHHVPTHAAVDALLGAPAGWMRDDAQRIRENNRKRTAMDAVQSARLPQSSSSAMLSPLHIDVHARRSSQYVLGSSSSSSGNIGNMANMSPRWSRAPSSWSISRLSSNGALPTSYTSPDYSSLDEEIYRSRLPALDVDDTSRVPRSAGVMAISPSPSMTSSSPRTSPSSTPSTSPATCSTPSFGPSRNVKRAPQQHRLTVHSFPASPDDSGDYFGDIYDHYHQDRPESYEMRVLSSSASIKGLYDTNSFIRIMSSQNDLPSTGFQKKRPQNNPYAHPVSIEKPSPVYRLSSSRPVIPQSTFERTLVPATTGSSKSSPASTALHLSLSAGTANQLNTEERSIMESKLTPAFDHSDGKSQDTPTSTTPGDRPAQWPLISHVQPEGMAF